MPALTKNSKSELQTVLKDRYKINKNISEELTADECRQLLSMLSQGNVSLEKILAAYADKNSALGKNNALYGRQRSNAEKKAIQLQQEYEELQKKNSQPSNLKAAVSSEHQRVVEQVGTLEEQKLQLSSKVKQLDASNNELVKVNNELRQDNRRLKDLEKEREELQKKNSQLSKLKTTVPSERQQLVKQVKTLEEQKLQLSSKVKQLDASNNELVKVNHELKKDNKRLTDLVDAIRLNLSKNVKDILRSEESEIKKVLAKIYQSLLG